MGRFSNEPLRASGVVGYCAANVSVPSGCAKLYLVWRSCGGLVQHGGHVTSFNCIDGSAPTHHSLGRDFSLIQPMHTFQRELYRSSKDLEQSVMIGLTVKFS